VGNRVPSGRDPPLVEAAESATGTPVCGAVEMTQGGITVLTDVIEIG
jgi:hypothetical protein